MSKIVEIKEAIEVAQKLRKQNKSIVVAGGFFDILHLGHIMFLGKAKKYGDYLFVLLEEDSMAAKKKGRRRPVNSQKNRAMILSALQDVDYVILLKNMTNNKAYDKLMIKIRPTVIATTDKDPHMDHKKRQAKLINGKVVYAIKRIKGYSTTEYIKLIT